MGRKSGLQTPPTISIIIPILNEAKILDKTLSQLQPELEPHELIIVDGGSSDKLCLYRGEIWKGANISAWKGKNS